MEQYTTTDYLSRLYIVFAVIFIGFYALYVIAEWRIMTKAGEKGWKALVPFYCVFVSHHIVGMSHAWFIAEIAVWCAELLFEIVKLPEPIVLCFGLAAGVFTLLSELIHVIRLCNCFGKGTGFKIGMALIPELFFMILAFGKAEYKKPAGKQ